MTGKARATPKPSKAPIRYRSPMPPSVLATQPEGWNGSSRAPAAPSTGSVSSR